MSVCSWRYGWQVQGQALFPRSVLARQDGAPEQCGLRAGCAGESSTLSNQDIFLKSVFRTYDTFENSFLIKHKFTRNIGEYLSIGF